MAKAKRIENRNYTDEEWTAIIAARPYEGECTDHVQGHGGNLGASWDDLDDGANCNYIPGE